MAPPIDVVRLGAMKLDVFRQLAEEWIPFNKLVGIRAIAIEKGDIRFEIPFRDELIGDPVKRALHGGVLSMLADMAGGFAVWTALEDEKARVSTIDLRVDYLKHNGASNGPDRVQALDCEYLCAWAGVESVDGAVQWIAGLFRG